MSLVFIVFRLFILSPNLSENWFAIDVNVHVNLHVLLKLWLHACMQTNSLLAAILCLTFENYT